MTRRRWLSWSFLVLVAGLSLTSTPADAAPRRRKPSAPTAAPAAKAQAKTPEPAPAPPDGVAGRRGPARIEFDDRLVQGQTNKANAIYLFERRESGLRSLVKKRAHFQAEIDEMLEAELVR